MPRVGRRIARYLIILFLTAAFAVSLSPASVEAASYNMELAESLALSDSVNVNKYSPRPESLSLADSVAASKFTPGSESLSLSDLVSIIVYWFNPEDVSEDLFIAESISAEKFTPGSESLNFSDALSVTVYRFVPKEASEGLSVGDVLAVNRYSPLYDAVSLSDEVRVGVYRPEEAQVLFIDYFSLEPWTSVDGVITKTVTLQSNNKALQLMILEGTRAKSKVGTRLAYISMLLMSPPLPSPPEHAYIISAVYDVGPGGASFDHPVILTLTYDPARLPEGISESDLVIACWDEGQSRWVLLDSVIDINNHTVTAAVTRLGMFTILGLEPGPAVFQVTDLAVAPEKVETGESVTVSVSVANTGGTLGTYNVVLIVNNAREAEKSVTVAAGSTGLVTFTLLKEDTGSYIVTADGLSVSFDVIALPVLPGPPETLEIPGPSPGPPASTAPSIPPPAPELAAVPENPVNWWLVGGISMGVIFIGVFVWKLVIFFRRD
jgi:hypothetical protein